MISMKKITLLFTFLCGYLFSSAQTPMQISGADCNGNNHDMFSELDGGKAVVVFFFMDNCGSCPPVATKVQTMVNNILANHPGMVTGYAMPYNNSTTCTATANWVTNNSLTFYSPFDSGATQVANYGGFGMPTVVLLGGAAPDRRVMFSTLSFANSDTTTMRDSILALLTPASTSNLNENISSLNVFPNPSSSTLNIQCELTSSAEVQIEMLDVMGRIVYSSSKEKAQTAYQKEIQTATLPNGNYTLRVKVNETVFNRKVNVLHY